MITPGTTFTNGQLVTAGDLNNLITNATIDSGVITPGMLATDSANNFITSNSELQPDDIRDDDFLLVWSSLHSGFRKVRKSGIGTTATTSSGGSAFSLSGTTLTLTSGGEGTATFSVSGSTLTITT